MTTTHPTARYDHAAIEADETVPMIHVWRDFAGTPEQLFRAHTDPELFARWVGPADRTVVIDRWDPSEGGAFRLRLHHLRGAHALDEAALLVRALVPAIHRLQHLVGLVQDEHRAFGHRDELRIGDEQRDLDDAIGVRLQSGHLHVDPDEVVLVGGHGLFYFACRMH